MTENKDNPLRNIEVFLSLLMDTKNKSIMNTLELEAYKAALARKC